jgi:hypothetical protein
MTSIELAALVDLIGEMKAHVAPTLAHLAKLERKLKANGVGRYQGLMYESNVFEQTRESLDMDAVRAKLSPQFITAHTTTKTVTVLKTTARQLGDDSIAEAA